MTYRFHARQRAVARAEAEYAAPGNMRRTGCDRGPPDARHS